eukprot:NODE_932_length_2992_cov_0.336675.p2 type:complete len:301 gc:universal NODE_932_length_2992_cov_0.336675:1789-2691(+)
MSWGFPIYRNSSKSFFFKKSMREEIFLSILLDQAESPITFTEFRHHYIKLGLDVTYLNFVKDIVTWYACSYVVCNLKMDLRHPIFDSIAKMVDRVDLEIDHSTIPEWVGNTTSSIVMEYFTLNSLSFLSILNEEIRIEILQEYKHGTLGIAIFFDVFIKAFDMIEQKAFRSFEKKKIKQNISIVDKINRLLMLSFAILVGLVLSFLLNALHSPPVLIFFVMIPFGYSISYVLHVITSSFCPNTANAKVRFYLASENHCVQEIRDEKVFLVQKVLSNRLIVMSKISAILISVVVAYGIYSC